MSLSPVNLSGNQPPIKLIIVEQNKDLAKAIDCNLKKPVGCLHNSDYQVVQTSDEFSKVISDDRSENILALCGTGPSWDEVMKRVPRNHNFVKEIGVSLKQWQEGDPKRKFMFVLNDNTKQVSRLPSEADKLPINTTDENQVYAMKIEANTFDEELMTLLQYFDSVIKSQPQV